MKAVPTKTADAIAINPTILRLRILPMRCLMGSSSLDTHMATKRRKT
jgi:hypothetical protein